MLDLSNLKDMEDNGQYPDMVDILEDACPLCNGQYRVGDYVCWNMCYTCAKHSGLFPEFLS